LNANIEKLNKKMLTVLEKGQEDLVQINWQQHDWICKFSGVVSPSFGILGDVEQQKMKLIDTLTDSQSSSFAVAIIGCCGMGKTTLARKVYDDSYIKNAFSTTIWVGRSKDSTDVGLLSAIVHAAGGKPRAEQQSRGKIMDMLVAILEGKRFLLVLDDVWSHQILESFIEDRLFVQHGSRVLITTQDLGVATATNRRYIHNIQEWHFQDYWSLLCTSAGLDKEHDRKNLREIGIMIIQRCNRVPLAIKIIGGVLGTKDPTLEEWQQVNESNYGLLILMTFLMV
jgi:hypothetical protein